MGVHVTDTIQITRHVNLSRHGSLLLAFRDVLFSTDSHLW